MREAPVMLRQLFALQILVSQQVSTQLGKQETLLEPSGCFMFCLPGEGYWTEIRLGIVQYKLSLLAQGRAGKRHDTSSRRHFAPAGFMFSPRNGGGAWPFRRRRPVHGLSLLQGAWTPSV
jgi:hypothetical protein